MKRLIISTFFLLTAYSMIAQTTPFDQTFFLGIPFNESEGFRVSAMDMKSSISLTDDYYASTLMIRLDKINTGYINLKIYTPKGKLIYNRTSHNTTRGTILRINYDRLPTGNYTLVIKSDHGQAMQKKIARSGGQMPGNAISVSYVR